MNIKTIMISLAFMGLALFAGKSRVIKISEYHDFEKGNFKNVYVKDTSILSLTPGCREFAMVDELITWALHMNDDGMYVGTGHGGNLYLLTPGGEVKKIYEISSPEITSFCEDADGNLYIGTGPKGIVYILKKGKSRPDIFCILSEQFVWSMDFYGGYIYAATGGDGKIFKIDPDTGKDELVFITSEENILDIKLNDGYIYAVTSGQGYLYRINSMNDYEILYDAGERDINDFIFMGEKIILSTTGKKILYKGNGFGKDDMSEGKSKNQYYENQVIEIDRSGNYDTLLTVKNQTIPSLVKTGDNTLLAGTSEEGEIYAIDLERRKVDKTYAIPQSSINTFIRHGDKIYFSTGTGARIYHVSLEYPREGSFISDVYDTKGTAVWGRVNYTSYSDKGAVRVFARTGNTFSPEMGWGGWQECVEGKLQNDDARFIQLKIVLEAAENSSPLISDVGIHFSRKNHPPQIFYVRTGRNLKIEKHNKISLDKKDLLVYWEAEDPDKDKLVYDLYYRGKLVKDWAVIEKDIKNNHFVLNKYAFIEGEYEFKVVVSDRYYNAEGLGYSDFAVSRKTIVDNTPPSINNFSVGASYITFDVQDNISLIKSCELSTRQSNFYQTTPRDNVYDSPEESFQVELDMEAPFVIIYTEDSRGNYIYRSFDLPGKKE